MEGRFGAFSRMGSERDLKGKKKREKHTGYNSGARPGRRELQGNCLGEEREKDRSVNENRGQSELGRERGKKAVSRKRKKTKR